MTMLWLDQLLQDLRFSGRTLLKSRALSATIVLVLGATTGVTTAIFSVVNGVLLRPLPFAEPERLVQINEIHLTGGAGSVFVLDLEEFRRQNTTFERMSGYGLTTRHLVGGAGLERLTTVTADGEFFPLLGVRPIAGRTFGAADPTEVAVISSALWERRFDRDAAVLGRTIEVDGEAFDQVQQRTVVVRRAYTVIGVMPDAFQFPYGAASLYQGAVSESPIDMWIPAEARPGGRVAQVTGRLKPGATAAAATADLTAIEARLDVVTGDRFRPTGVQVAALSDAVLGPVRDSLWLLLVAALLVLTAACANVANLLLSRLTTRSSEVVTRAALGAGPLRLVRQYLAESLLLSVAGALLGVVIARWSTTVLVAFASSRIPRSPEVSLDWTVFAFLAFVCLAVALMCGLAPSVLAARTNVRSATRSDAGQETAGTRSARIRDALIVVEVALAFVLACGAAAVVSELRRLQAVDSGMLTDNVLTLHLTPQMPFAMYNRLEERVSQVPGVEAAGLIHMVPLQNWGGIGTFQVRGRPPQEFSTLPTAELRSVTPGYFATLGIPIRAGRNLNERDGVLVPRPILINDALARAQFPGESPIGREMDRGIIVGVVGDVRHAGLDRPAVPAIYFPHNAGIAADIGMSLLVRTEGPPQGIIGGIRSAIREVNPNLAVFDVKTMEQVVDESLWELNLYRSLIGLFALLTVGLSAIGLYGVVSHGVTARLREFGVRIALGSSPNQLARLVMVQGVRLAVTGILIGLGLGIAALQLMRERIGGEGTNPGVVAGAAGAIVVLALLACAIPARRVAVVDPALALRRD
jgi:putative ABC transport system permease protein